MALGKAALAGAAAALAVPYLLADHPSIAGEFVRASLVRLAPAGVEIAWSWTLFAIVTLFAWGFLAWSNR
jgi:hypothetical protein